ncbi:hypothetical protein [Thermococcus piezophilus]|nr:hypothetical protein [Thermococcus piezophilus]
MSMLLASLSPHVLQPRYMYFPSSFTVIFFIFIVYLILSTQPTLKSYILLVIALIVTLFSHPLIPLILIFTFSVILATSKLLKISKMTLSRSIILFFVILTLTKWMMSTSSGETSFFELFILSVKHALTSEETFITSATLAPLYTWSDIILYDLGMVILMFWGIVGGFYILSSHLDRRRTEDYPKKEKIKKSSLLSIFALLFIPLPYILTVLYPQSLPSRWFPFIEIIMSIFGSVGIIITSQILSKRNFQYVASLITCILVFFMITSPIVNPNSQIYATKLSNRQALTESEIYSGLFLNSLHINEVHANSKYLIFVNTSLARPENFINPKNPNTYKSGLVVIRNYDLQKGFTIPLFGAKGKLLEIIRPSKQFYNFLRNSNKIYENGEVRVYFS